MRKLVMGCAVAGLIALSPKPEARPPASVDAPLPIVVPHEKEKHKSQIGMASWYGEECIGNDTASGEPYDLNGLTAAHRELPLGTTIKITNLRNHKTLQLRVNDRGPSVHGRMVDVSWGAAKRLGFLGYGVTRVRMEVVAYPQWYLRQSSSVN